MKNNERNAGRKKGTNMAHTVRCHPKVIKDVRKYAKEQSEKYLEQLKKPKCVHDWKTNISQQYQECKKYGKGHAL